MRSIARGGCCVVRGDTVEKLKNLFDLTIEYIPIDELTPNPKNARKHEQLDIDNTAKSIEKYGFNDPVGIAGKNNMIVEGHGRMLACRKLGIKLVPCVRLDHMNEQELREYAIAHNATAELSTWDRSILPQEVEELDFSDFNFKFDNIDFETPQDIEEAEEEKEKVNERERTYKLYNLQFNDLERVAGKYQMPIIQREIITTPKKQPLGFNYVLSTKEKDRAVHMFLDDYQIERLWSNPEMYVDKLMDFDCVFTPDFSLYSDMPIAMQIWNTYRSRLVGQIMQDYGIKVIPTVSWGAPETFEFCFDGIEQGSIVVVSTIGVKRDEAATKIWRDGMDEMIKRIKPYAIWVYGGQVEYDYKGIPTTFFDNEVTERLKNEN